MDVQELLKTVEAQMSLGKSVDTGRLLIPPVMKTLEDAQVVFEDSAAVGFISHLFNLVKRLDDGEHLPPAEPEILEQIEEIPLNISRRVGVIFETHYRVTLDEAEIVLIAIHVQTAMMA